MINRIKCLIIDPLKDEHDYDNVLSDNLFGNEETKFDIIFVNINDDFSPNLILLNINNNIDENSDTCNPDNANK